MRLVSFQDLYCSRMDSWKPTRSFANDMWVLGRTKSSIHPTQSPSLPPRSISGTGWVWHLLVQTLVDGVTVMLNYPLLDQRPTCCENSEQGFQPFLICTQKITLHSVLWLFSEDKWRRCSTFQSSAVQENYPCMGVSRIWQNSRQRVDHTKTKDARRPKRGPTRLGPSECETQ